MRSGIEGQDEATTQTLPARKGSEVAVKLFFYGSEMLSLPEHQVVVPQNPEELGYIRKIEAEMLAVINEFGVYGLAAPQLGYSLQMIVVKLGEGKRLTLLNPVIEQMYGSETDYAEGCISCPPGGNQCPTPRMQFINVAGTSIDKPAEMKNWAFTSHDARVVQHEIDHLNGTFFFERAELVEKPKVLERFHQWKRTMKSTPNFGLGGNNGRFAPSTQAQHS